MLDHSGNCARFWQQTNDFFEHGVVELDDGKKKAKEKPKQVEKEPVKCPQCRVLHKPAPVCPCCGHEYPRRQTVQHVPGTLKELLAATDFPGRDAKLRHELWPQLVGYVFGRGMDGEVAQKRAQAYYKEITGDFARARIETTEPAPISSEVSKRIRSVHIRWNARRATEKRAA